MELNGRAASLSGGHPASPLSSVMGGCDLNTTLGCLEQLKVALASAFLCMAQAIDAQSFISSRPA
ncbi:MAG: hypothetical protein ACK528_05140 [Alphaproteobacteria bacterium]